MKVNNIPDIPVKKVQATILEKGKYVDGWGDNASIVYYATFAFIDGTRHRMDIGGFRPRKTYKTLRENESGVLYYKGADTLIKFDSDDTQLLSLHKPTVSIRSKSVNEPENELKVQKYLVRTDKQRIDATVLGKFQSKWSSKMYIEFSFEDGTTKKLSVSISNYAIIMKGDIGVLTFEKKGKDDMFIDFERDVSL